MIHGSTESKETVASRRRIKGFMKAKGSFKTARNLGIRDKRPLPQRVVTKRCGRRPVQQNKTGSVTGTQC